MDGYRDQIVTHDVGVSLHSKTHPLFMKYSNGTSTVLCISLSELVSCAFSTIPICPFLIPRIFHLLVSALFFLLQIACEYLWSGENTICINYAYVHSILTKRVPLFAT